MCNAVWWGVMNISFQGFELLSKYYNTALNVIYWFSCLYTMSSIYLHTEQNIRYYEHYDLYWIFNDVNQIISINQIRSNQKLFNRIQKCKIFQIQVAICYLYIKKWRLRFYKRTKILYLNNNIKYNAKYLWDRQCILKSEKVNWY